ncbi:TetR/AcrR family transcriptional regulator [Streptococcus uberis]|uniref:TetR/AcrR family transcriptional regulator n=1 Tax=Streptococcus uberis TaxID=1349 RepID=UPI001FF21FD0|nr:TetR/AcrR family transcriptional regulator [Streptococcus uberis]MCK1189614.1 TetR/AcrR family transcriptional regulator [Streptococcus uberis]MCK1207901.1 TetR/AcrR family transcriptional regulator [Streptococcus uberis]
MTDNIIFSIENYVNTQEIPNGKKKVILSAIQLFASQGFHGTSTAQLAQQANVSQATIYKYFETKEAILVYIFELMTHIISYPFLKQLSSFQTKKELIHYFVTDRYNFIAHNYKVVNIILQELLINPEIISVFKNVIKSRSDVINNIFQRLENGNNLTRLEIIRIILTPIMAYYCQVHVFNIKSNNIDDDLKDIENQILSLL